MGKIIKCGTIAPAILRDRNWTHEERVVLANFLLEGHSIEESAGLATLLLRAIPILGPDATREVMRHGGILPFVYTYRPQDKTNSIALMREKYVARGGTCAESIPKPVSRKTTTRRAPGRQICIRLSSLAALAHLQIYDQEVSDRFTKLVEVISGLAVNTIPHVWVDRLMLQTSIDRMRCAQSDLVPTVRVRCEVPRGVARGKQDSGRKKYLLFCAQLIEGITSLIDPKNRLHIALRRSRARRIQFFVIDHTQSGERTELIYESPLLQEQQSLT